jgi:hypothetical protein
MFKKTTVCFLQSDPGWAEDWKDPLFHILRDIAEPSGVDPHYTLTRYTVKKLRDQEANVDVVIEIFDQSQM